MQKILFTKKIAKKELSIFDANFTIKTENFINITYLYPNEIPFSDHFILTSQNGFESLINLFSIDYLKDKNYYVVGEKTKQKLAYFTNNILEFAETAEELAQKIIPLHQTKFVHFCSNLRLPILKEQLESNQKIIQEINSYKTELNEKKINDVFNGIVFFSPSGVESFFKNNEIPKETTIFALGKSTASKISHFNDSFVEIPESANSNALFSLIKERFDAKK